MVRETQQPTVSESQTDQHFMFRCGAAWFSVPAIAVRELSLAPEIVSVPGCHRSFEGLCRQQSEFIPVIALDALLDFETSDQANAHNQLLTLAGNNIWAIRIAEAAGLETLDTIASTDTFHSNANSQGVVGTATHGDKFVRVLNPDQLYQTTHRALEASWSRAHTTDKQTLMPIGGNR
jgi:chemotaxis signal transduction protein